MKQRNILMKQLIKILAKLVIILILQKFLLKQSKINDAEEILNKEYKMTIFLYCLNLENLKDKKNFEKSTEYFEKVLSINPQFPNLLF